MRKRLIFILGGARGGKSLYAQRMAGELDEAVLFVATAEAGDKEMAARVASHKAARPKTWHTLEAPQKIGKAISKHPSQPGVILIDCLTLLVSNVLTSLPEPLTAPEAEAALGQEIDEMLVAYKSSEATWIVVSNEVGWGIVPPYPLGRIYRDALGKVNQHVASEADEVILMIAGLPLMLKR